MILRPAIVLSFLAALPLMTLIASAADHRDRFEARMFTDAGGKTLPYRLLSPKEIKPREKYPLVLFFHGAGECGTDNEKQLVHAMNDFAADEIMDRFPAFVLAPQCPEGQQWVDTPWSADSHTMKEQPTAPLAQSLELVDSLVETLPIDTSRLYITGLSMGGFGAWDAIQRHPQRFAAAVIVCGGGDPAYAEKMKHLPVWLFHGECDTAVQPKRSRDMAAALQRAGGTPQYTEYPQTGHDSWTKTYADRQVYRWLFSQRLP